MDLEVESFEAVLKKAEREEKRSEAHRQWTALLPLMNTKTIKYESFEDYFARQNGENLDLRPSNEIIDEVNEIRRKMREGDGSI